LAGHSSNISSEDRKAQIDQARRVALAKQKEIALKKAQRKAIKEQGLDDSSYSSDFLTTTSPVTDEVRSQRLQAVVKARESAKQNARVKENERVNRAHAAVRKEASKVYAPDNEVEEVDEEEDE